MQHKNTLSLNSMSVGSGNKYFLQKLSTTVCSSVGGFVLVWVFCVLFSWFSALTSFKWVPKGNEIDCHLTSVSVVKGKHLDSTSTSYQHHDSENKSLTQTDKNQVLVTEVYYLFCSDVIKDIYTHRILMYIYIYTHIYTYIYIHTQS